MVILYTVVLAILIDTINSTGANDSKDASILLLIWIWAATKAAKCSLSLFILDEV